VQTRQIRRNPTDWTAPAGAAGLSAAAAGQSLDRPGAEARIIQLEQGLYALEIGEAAASTGQLSGLPLPAIQVSAPPGERNQCVEIIASSGAGGSWVGFEGGTVIVKAPSGGGQVVVTAYGLPGELRAPPRVEIRRLDRPRPNGHATIAAAGAPTEIRTEVVLHIERLGDRRFPGEGWVGNRGHKLRIEAFSIRPIEVLEASDIEFKALGPKGRETPWVTDAKLCGTRGQGLPLTGFAARLAPHLSGQFDVVYEGSFFESGIAGPNRNGELCTSAMADDPLEAINLRLIRRVTSREASR